MTTHARPGIYFERYQGQNRWFCSEGGYWYEVPFNRIVKELAGTRFVKLVFCPERNYIFCRYEVKE